MRENRLLLADAALATALYRLHVEFDGACRSACDIGLETCAVLADIAACEQGFAVKQAAKRYRFFGEITQFEHILRERELITLTRYANDRRALAYLASSKGIERLLMIDQILGSRLVTSGYALTEDSVDKLVELFYAYASACGEDPFKGCLFPACILRALGVYRHLLVTSAARFGMTSAQVVVLALLAERDLRGSVDSQRPAGAALDAQMAFLQERGFVEVDERSSITEAGEQRLVEFVNRLNASAAACLNDASSRERMVLADLSQYVRYLFA